MKKITLLIDEETFRSTENFVDEVQGKKIVLITGCIHHKIGVIIFADSELQLLDAHCAIASLREAAQQIAEKTMQFEEGM